MPGVLLANVARDPFYSLESPWYGRACIIVLYKTERANTLN